MSEEQLHNLDISLRQLNVHLQSSIPNRFKLAVIRGYNEEHGYPEASLNGHPDLTKVLYNRAINEIHFIHQQLFRLPVYDSIFTHPLSDHYPLAEQASFVEQYKELLRYVNHPRVVSICDGHDHNTFRVETREVSTYGHWVTVCQTVFLDRPLKRISCDIYAPSSVRAPPHNDLLIAPIGIIYNWPFELCGPHEPTPPSSDDGDSSE
jgi:hypothetical protein